jgi:hypothetical protein
MGSPVAIVAATYPPRVYRRSNAKSLHVPDAAAAAVDAAITKISKTVISIVFVADTTGTAVIAEVTAAGTIINIITFVVQEIMDTTERGK